MNAKEFEKLITDKIHNFTEEFGKRPTKLFIPDTKEYREILDILVTLYRMYRNERYDNDYNVKTYQGLEIIYYNGDELRVE